jgi:hypothetical protein
MTTDVTEADVTKTDIAIQQTAPASNPACRTLSVSNMEWPKKTEKSIRLILSLNLSGGFRVEFERKSNIQS